MKIVVIYRTVTSTLVATFRLDRGVLPDRVMRVRRRIPHHCWCGCLRVVWTDLQSYDPYVSLGIYSATCS
jgi:hypothetical protein